MMKHKIFTLIFTQFIAFTVIAAGVAVKRVSWDRAPIQLTIKIGEKRMVYFPKSGDIQRVGILPSINRSDVLSKLETTALKDTIYLLAYGAFERQVIQVITEKESYLLEVSASEKGDTAPVEITPRIRHTSQLDVVMPKLDSSPGQKIGYVTLTRFAAQQMYAPKRMLRPVPGIVRVPVDTQLSRPLVRGSEVESLPLISWRGGGFYVTAIRLQNKTNEHVILDPRELRGHWKTATFQHVRLFPNGHEADTTVVYLISSKPFEL